jgi:uncharacterized protein YhaN
MRLNRLDLTRFGSFTDHTIDFGERSAGEPDFHIVYGLNEAGKSTALAAFLDLIFGIATQSQFNFLHPYPTMRIGASLQLSGGPQEFVRIKRPQNSLLDRNDQPISEGVILGQLGGIDRESYRTMFSLDDETLEAGGQSILASKGDLGQLLFSASAGLADLSRSLIDLRAEADGFYKYRARGGELADLKGRIAALRSERERIDVLAPQYANLVEARDRTNSQYEDAISRRGEIQSRVEEIQRFLNALPRLASLRATRERLVPLAELPNAPFGWREELPELLKGEIELTTRADGIADEIVQLESEIAAIVVDETAASLATRVEGLPDLRARYMTAEKDIPERRLQRRAAELEIAGLLRKVDRDGEQDPAGLVLGAAVVGALRGLIETRSGVETALKSANDELSEARRRLEEAEGRLKQSGGRTEAEQENAAQATSLVATVAALRADDYGARRRLASRSRALHLEALADRIRELQPWQGDLQQLVEAVIPDAGTIERWKSTTFEAQKKVQQHEGDIERLTTEQSRLNAELNSLGNVVGVVSDQEASGVRAARERAWAVHRRALDAGSADGFEAALRHDDVVTNARLGHTADLARLHQTTQALAVVVSELGRAQQLRDASGTVLQRVREEIDRVVSAMAPTLPSDMSPQQLEAWFARRTKALEVRDFILAAERDLHDAETDAKAARERLTTALTAAAVAHDADATIDVLLRVAQSAVDREIEVKNVRDAVEGHRSAVRDREREVEKAALADRTWAAAWAQACSACWLGADGSILSVAVVRKIIAVTAELGPAIEKQAGLGDRISKMENDQALFTAEVNAIAHALGLVGLSGAILDLAQSVNESVETARAAQANRVAKIKSLESARGRQRGLADALAIHSERKAKMTAFFGVGSLEEVGVKLQSSQRKADLEEQAAATSQEIIDALGLPTIDEAEQVLNAADRSALEVELAEQKARFNDQDQRSRDLFSAHSKAVDQIEAVGGDGAVAQIEAQRRTALVDIEERALRYLRLRAGTAAADQALRIYRDRHRSSMMARASEAFRTISRRAYTGLATQPEKETETLIAIAAEGGSKLATELSKGTRFQLYLALRVAGYYEFARSRQSVPFIADDIMETFDEFRAEEALRLFAEMAEVGQVIYLTHHRHLCDIAQRVCPTVKVHELSAIVARHQVNALRAG